MYLLEMTMNLLLCGYHTDLEQMLEKKIFIKMDSECWKLLVKWVFSLKELIIQKL